MNRFNFVSQYEQSRKSIHRKYHREAEMLMNCKMFISNTSAFCQNIELENKINKDIDEQHYAMNDRESIDVFINYLIEVEKFITETKEKLKTIQ